MLVALQSVRWGRYMCELLTILANREVSASLSWAGLQMGASRNPHGWGVAWLRGADFEAKKNPTTLPSGRRGRELIHGVRSALFVAHTRYRVQGRQTRENTQPFLSADGRYAFAGTMDKCLGRRGLRKRVQHRLQGETGPEVLFQLLVGRREANGLARIRPVVKEFFALDGLPQGARASFAFLDTNTGLDFSPPETPASPSSGWPVPWHSYLLARIPSQLPLQADSKGGKGATDRAAIVATEKLTNENWEPVPDRTLFLVTLNGLQRA